MEIELNYPTYLNRSTVFSFLRKAPFGGRLTQMQVDAVNKLLDESITLPLEYTAYVIATVFHETGGTMDPKIKENLNYTTAAAIQKTWPTRFKSVADAVPYVKNAYKLAEKVYGGRMGNKSSGDGFKYRGHSWPQLTGRDNFKKAGFENNPDGFCDAKVAGRYMIDAMLAGKFTGAKLQDFRRGDNFDAVGARKTVNGTDKAKLIAGYYKNIFDALVAGTEYGSGMEYASDEAKPDDVKAKDSAEVVVGALSAAGGVGGLSLVLGSIGNIWGFLSLAMIIGGGGLITYMYMTGRITISRK